MKGVDSIMLWKKRSKEEREYRHYSWIRAVYYVYLLISIWDLLIFLAGLTSILSRPASETVIMDSGSHLWFYILDGSFARFPKEFLPFTVDTATVNGQVFAASFILLTLVSEKVPLLFILWKGYRILRIMRHSYSPFMPEIAGHICWIGRTALFIGFFKKLILQGGMSLIIDHDFMFENPMEISWILTGLILLLVSDIYKRGCALQKEVDETL